MTRYKFEILRVKESCNLLPFWVSWEGDKPWRILYTVIALESILEMSKYNK